MRKLIFVKFADVNIKRCRLIAVYVMIVWRCKMYLDAKYKNGKLYLQNKVGAWILAENKRLELCDECGEIFNIDELQNGCCKFCLAEMEEE